MNHILSTYKNCYQSVKDELRRIGCGGSVFDEIYHEAFLVLMENEESGVKKEYNGGYLALMCKHLWYKEQKRRQVHVRIEEVESSIPYHENLFSQENMKFLVIKHMNLLSEKCREILTLYSLDFSEKKISRVLDLDKREKVKNRKYYCIEKLHKMIINDPLFNELYE